MMKHLPERSASVLLVQKTSGTVQETSGFPASRKWMESLHQKQ
jgi:hypothetical protein